MRPLAPLTAVLLLALLNGCDGGAAADRDDPLEVAEAYAIADHELDHGTVYDLLAPAALEGANRDEWIAEQEDRLDETDDPGSRYRGDWCHDRQPEPREVAEVAPRDQGESNGLQMDPGLRVVHVTIDFAEGETQECLYGLQQDPDGNYEVVTTEDA